MSRIIQIRRGTTAQNDNFTGLVGELTFDTDAKTLRVHDGEKLGGYALARADAITNGDGNTGGTSAGDDTSGTQSSTDCKCENCGGAGGTEFDISSVPDEFWRALFERFAPSTGDDEGGDTTGGLRILDSAAFAIPSSDDIIEYIFLSQEVALFAQVMLTCRTADAGYSPGDVCTAIGIGDYCTPLINTYTDDEGLHVCVASNQKAVWVAHKTTGVRTNITNSKWRMKFRVYY